MTLEERDVGAGRELRPALWTGLLLWVAFGVVALALRGVRWDENYEFAQVLAGTVPYPEAHPARQYLSGAYSLQVMASVWLLRATDSAAIVCGFRNLLFIWASVLPVYWLGAVLGRRQVWGHVAAVLILSRVHLEFDGAYPQFLWPGMFSNGHIGTGWVLLAVGFFLSGHLRVAYLMAGLSPAAHLGQAPPLLCFLALHAVVTWKTGSMDGLRRAAPYFVVGALASLGALGLQQGFAVSPVTEGPYFSTEAARPIWEARTQFHDLHRQIPRGNSYGLAVGALLVGGLGLVGRGTARNPEWRLICLYGAIVLGMVYGIMGIHWGLGNDVPYILLRWLPYRLWNHIPLLLVPMLVAVLTARSGPREWTRGFLLTLTLLFVLLRPYMVMVLDNEGARRYLGATDSVLYGLLGGAFVVLFMELDGRRSLRAWCVGLAAISWIGLASYHQFGAACVAAGAAFIGLGTAVSRKRPSVEHARSAAIACAGLCVLILVGVFRTQYAHQRHLPVGEFETRVAAYLDERGEPDVMLVGGPAQLLLQAQTGHPMLVDMATGFYGGYVPKLGPSANKIYREVYSIDFTRAVNEPAWTEVWEARSGAEWEALGERYGFGYVIAPRELEVRLDAILSGPNDTFYALPGRAE